MVIRNHPRKAPRNLTGKRQLPLRSANGSELRKMLGRGSPNLWLPNAHQSRHLPSRLLHNFASRFSGFDTPEMIFAEPGAKPALKRRRTPLKFRHYVHLKEFTEIYRKLVREKLAGYEFDSVKPRGADRFFLYLTKLVFSTDKKGQHLAAFRDFFYGLTLVNEKDYGASSFADAVGRLKARLRKRGIQAEHLNDYINDHCVEFRRKMAGLRGEVLHFRNAAMYLLENHAISLDEFQVTMPSLHIMSRYISVLDTYLQLLNEEV